MWAGRPCRPAWTDQGDQGLQAERGEGVDPLQTVHGAGGGRGEGGELLVGDEEGGAVVVRVAHLLQTGQGPVVDLQTVALGML